MAGGGHVLGGHGALDDEEVGTPVAERQHEAEAEDHGEHPRPSDWLGPASSGFQALVQASGCEGFVGVIERLSADGFCGDRRASLRHRHAPAADILSPS